MYLVHTIYLYTKQPNRYHYGSPQNMSPSTSFVNLVIKNGNKNEMLEDSRHNHKT